MSLHNEELQWKLKQNSERFTTALNELSKTYQDQSSFLNECKNSLYGPILETSYETSSEKADSSITTDTVSPPTSPMVKGVVEKNDSVSWVLEINDEESAEALANRMVKRAGSFRTNLNERSPSFKRQLSLGPNALAQSASTASILRQHSEFSNQSHGTSPKQTKSPRNRSQSLTANSENKKVIRSASEAMPCDYDKWKEPLSTSSPLHLGTHKNTIDNIAKDLLFKKSGEFTSSKPRARSSSMGVDEQLEQAATFHQRTDIVKEGLITCDTSALSSPRTEFCPSLSTHTAKLKKCQQIKESAGEAMISGIAFEDEASFGSGSSLSSTPMEVSWSDDGENEPYAQESSA